MFRPDRFDVPQDLKTMIENSLSYGEHKTSRQDRTDKSGGDVEHNAKHAAEQRRLYYDIQGLTPFRKPIFIQIDLNGDGVMEYVLIGLNQSGWTRGLCFYLLNNTWIYKELILVSPSPTAKEIRTQNVDLANILQQGEIRTLQPPFQDIQVGKLRFKVSR